MAKRITSSTEIRLLWCLFEDISEVLGVILIQESPTPPSWARKRKINKVMITVKIIITIK